MVVTIDKAGRVVVPKSTNSTTIERRGLSLGLSPPVSSAYTTPAQGDVGEGLVPSRVEALHDSGTGDDKRRPYNTRKLAR